mgnify:CR=1 FL=1
MYMIRLCIMMNTNNQIIVVYLTERLCVINNTSFFYRLKVALIRNSIVNPDITHKNALSDFTLRA